MVDHCYPRKLPYRPFYLDIPMIRYLRHLFMTQQEPAHPDQVKNNAGGYSFAPDCWARLDRWLILGAEGGTYYVSERTLTRENAKTIEECLQLDGPRTVKTIVEISHLGRAPKNEPAIFALALAASNSNELTRREAFLALPKVCRTGTHLFHFAGYVEHFRRWGKGLRNAIARWYTEPSLDRVALQAVKYQQRDGWSHRDLLRLSHPQTQNSDRNALFRWIVAGTKGFSARELLDTKQNHRRFYDAINEGNLPKIVQGFERCKRATSAKEVAQLITDYQLPQECVPNEWKSYKEVWEALLPHMGMQALLRNLGKMSSIGFLAPLSNTIGQVQATLLDSQRIQKERIHPLSLLVAMNVYGQGRGEKGSLTWEVSPTLMETLNQSFYLAFQTIEPTGKRYLLALDCSASMDSGRIARMSMTPREGSAAMALVTARTESNWHMCGFNTEMVPVAISPSMRLDQVTDTLRNTPWGGTDCAQPMLWATKNKIEVDTFVIYTDNETWAGQIHPHKALEQYRQQMGKNAKLIVVGMTSNRFTIANPNDAGMLDVVGFDTAAPALMADFSRNDSY